jgi:hypothetical protein
MLRRQIGMSILQSAELDACGAKVGRKRSTQISATPLGRPKLPTEITACAMEL